MRIEIKSRIDGSVLFTHEAEENSIKITVEMAAANGVSLRNADLRSADLTKAKLTYAGLTDADLTYADLTDAKLTKGDLK